MFNQLARGSDSFRSRLEILFRRAIETKRTNFEVVGMADSVGLAALISSIAGSADLPKSHVVLTADFTEAENLAEDLQFFAPHLRTHILPPFDVSPYSGVYPNSRGIGSRLSWLYAAQVSAPDSIFIATAEALSQLTLPKDIFQLHQTTLRVGSVMPPKLTDELVNCGYFSTPLVEDIGQYSVRGGIFDIFSPAHDLPVRIELFGDVIESIRFFDPEIQRSKDTTQSVEIIPTREVIFMEETRQRAAQTLKKDCDERGVSKKSYDKLLRPLALGEFFNGVDFLLPYFYEHLESPLDYFSNTPCIWHLDSIGINRSLDDLQSKLNSEYKTAATEPIAPSPDLMYRPQALLSGKGFHVQLSKIKISDFNEESEDSISHVVYKSQPLTPPKKSNQISQGKVAEKILLDWKEQGYQVYVSAPSPVKRQRLKGLFQDSDLKFHFVEATDDLWHTWEQEQTSQTNIVHVIPRSISQNYHFPEEKTVVLDDNFLLGTKKSKTAATTSVSALDKVKALSFADLKVGDLVVHIDNGIGQFDGLKKLQIQGVDAEFITLKYKDNDKLYLPVYRIDQIQKYSGPSSTFLLDKLGGGQWEQTKIKVKSKLRDIAADLLKLYAARAQIERPPFPAPDEEYYRFEDLFPFEETPDQEKAISDILNDLNKKTPMDRLVCGDVGFGKTEIAMRAAFKVLQNKKLVLLMAPTTVLTYQHYETFKRRFAQWPFEIRLLNRFVPRAEVTKTLRDLAAGKVDVVIGTHRLLSKDVVLNNLGLIIVDEEHKFGVVHKEKIRQISTHVDTLALSATPIPRTLNMSLVGIRDISLISTAPIDRLPIRTFICKFDEETIRKAVQAEMARGGQAFFIHNRIETIYGIHDQLKQLLPNIKLAVAHGQMEAKALEDIIIAFFKKEIDVLLCTTIIESGMDIPNANTMFIDRSDTFGLSQLYQLRGRIGRSKKRAYCYLLIPESGNLEKEAQERLKVIQENTALGSGFKVAHYDLELRGAGNILGEDQSGHISAVGFELYYELLEEALHTAKGEPPPEPIPEPDINVRIPALIPDSYIPDIRLRLAYYKSFSKIKSHEDIDRVEDELRDQFGPIPEVTSNLMGLMLVRSLARTLRIRDLSSGAKSISLAFTDKTPLPPAKVVHLATLPNKKYSLTKDNRLNIRMNEITWPNIFEELSYLIKLC